MTAMQRGTLDRYGDKGAMNCYMDTHKAMNEARNKSLPPPLPSDVETTKKTSLPVTMSQKKVKNSQSMTEPLEEDDEAKEEEFCRQLEKFESVVHSFTTEFLESQFYEKMDTIPSSIPKAYNLKMKIKLMNHLLLQFDCKTRKLLQEEVLSTICHLVCHQRRIYKTPGNCSDILTCNPSDALCSCKGKNLMHLNNLIKRLKRHYRHRMNDKSFSCGDLEQEECKLKLEPTNKSALRPKSPRVVPAIHYQNVIDQIFQHNCCQTETDESTKTQHSVDFPPAPYDRNNSTFGNLNGKPQKLISAYSTKAVSDKKKCGCESELDELSNLGWYALDSPEKRRIMACKIKAHLKSFNTISPFNLRPFGEAMDSYRSMLVDRVYTIQSFEDCLLSYTMLSRCIPLLWCGNGPDGEPVYFPTEYNFTGDFFSGSLLPGFNLPSLNMLPPRSRYSPDSWLHCNSEENRFKSGWDDKETKKRQKRRGGQHRSGSRGDSSGSDYDKRRWKAREGKRKRRKDKYEVGDHYDDKHRGKYKRQKSKGGAYRTSSGSTVGSNYSKDYKRRMKQSLSPHVFNKKDYRRGNSLSKNNLRGSSFGLQRPTQNWQSKTRSNQTRTKADVHDPYSKKHRRRRSSSSSTDISEERYLKLLTNAELEKKLVKSLQQGDVNPEEEVIKNILQKRRRKEEASRTSSLTSFEVQRDKNRAVTKRQKNGRGQDNDDPQHYKYGKDHPNKGRNGKGNRERSSQTSDEYLHNKGPSHTTNPRNRSLDKNRPGVKTKDKGQDMDLISETEDEDLTSEQSPVTGQGKQNYKNKDGGGKGGQKSRKLGDLTTTESTHTLNSNDTNSSANNQRPKGKNLPDSAIKRGKSYAGMKKLSIDQIPTEGVHKFGGNGRNKSKMKVGAHQGHPGDNHPDHHQDTHQDHYQDHHQEHHQDRHQGHLQDHQDHHLQDHPYKDHHQDHETGGRGKPKNTRTPHKYTDDDEDSEMGENGRKSADRTNYKAQRSKKTIINLNESGKGAQGPKPNKHITISNQDIAKNNSKLTGKHSTEKDARDLRSKDRQERDNDFPGGKNKNKDKPGSKSSDNGSNERAKYSKSYQTGKNRPPFRPSSKHNWQEKGKMYSTREDGWKNSEVHNNDHRGNGSNNKGGRRNNTEPSNAKEDARNTAGDKQRHMEPSRGKDGTLSKRPGDSLAVEDNKNVHDNDVGKSSAEAQWKNITQSHLHPNTKNKHRPPFRRMSQSQVEANNKNKFAPPPHLKHLHDKISRDGKNNNPYINYKDQSNQHPRGASTYSTGSQPTKRISLTWRGMYDNKSKERIAWEHVEHAKSGSKLRRDVVSKPSMALHHLHMTKDFRKGTPPNPDFKETMLPADASRNGKNHRQWIKGTNAFTSFHAVQWARKSGSFKNSGRALKNNLSSSSHKRFLNDSKSNPKRNLSATEDRRGLLKNYSSRLTQSWSEVGAKAKEAFPRLRPSSRSTADLLRNSARRADEAGDSVLDSNPAHNLNVRNSYGGRELQQSRSGLLRDMKRKYGPTFGRRRSELDRKMPIAFHSDTGRSIKEVKSRIFNVEMDMPIDLNSPQENFFWVPLGKYSWEMRNIKVWKSKVLNPREEVGSKEYMHVFPEIKLNQPAGDGATQSKDLNILNVAPNIIAKSSSCQSVCCHCLRHHFYCCCAWL